MAINENVLYWLAKRWPSPVQYQRAKLGTDLSSLEYHINYALFQQYDLKVKTGIPQDIRNKDIVEIGCGHGGISTFMAVNGARKVVGIDLNTFHLQIANAFKERTQKNLGGVELPVSFREMNAYEMTFEPESFDLVFADNVFEHFMEPEKVMQQSFLILRKGGKLIVPTFSSIWSKYALHLKHGLKMPWANLLFSEQTICNVMVKLSHENPEIKEIYPGVLESPKKVRDLRKYKDLNDITYNKFKQMAQNTGFEIEQFAIKSEPRLVGSLLRKMPLMNSTILTDIFSTSAGAVLIKNDTKTAIIGLGPHGQRILKACLQIPELEITALVDRNNDVLQKALPERDELYYNNTTDLYNSSNKPEVLIIATNGPSHHPLTIEAIEYGVKYIMVEKPMACSVKEAEEMEEAARIGGVRLSIDKPIRHDDLYVWLHQQIISGEWGEMRNIYIQKPGIGLGCLGTHSFDLCNYLMNDFPGRVTAWVDEPVGKNPRGEQFVDPGGLVVLEYAKNKRAIVTQIEDGAGPQSIEINLTGARIYHDTKNGLLDIRKRDLNIKPGPSQPVVYIKIEPEINFNIKGDLVQMIKKVLMELISDSPMKTDAVYGRNAIEILAAAYISNNKGNQPVALPLNNPSDKNIYFPIT